MHSSMSTRSREGGKNGSKLAPEAPSRDKLKWKHKTTAKKREEYPHKATRTHKRTHGSSTQYLHNCESGRCDRVSEVTARRGDRADNGDRALARRRAEAGDLAGALVELGETGGQVGRVAGIGGHFAESAYVKETQGMDFAFAQSS